MLNLDNNKVIDIDCYYASQLCNEASAVDDIHTHPSEPRSFQLSLRVSF